MYFFLCHYFIVFNIIINVFRLYLFITIIVIIATIMNVNLYGNNLYYYYYHRILCCFINFSYIIVVHYYYYYRYQSYYFVLLKWWYCHY